MNERGPFGTSTRRACVVASWFSAALLASLAALARAARFRGKSEHMLWTIVEHSPNVVFIKDVEGRYLFVNPAAAAVLGAPVAEIIGKRDSDFVDPEQVRFWRQHESAAIRQQAPISIADRIVLPDGTKREYSTTYFPYVTPSGAVVGVVGIAFDITERRRAEVAQARLAAIVTASPDAIVGVDPKTRTVKTWNPGATTLFGYTAEEAVGKPVSFVVPPDRMRETVEAFAQVAQGNQLEAFESVRLHKDGRRIEVWVTLFPVRDDQGRIISLSAIVRDLTELRRAQQEVAIRTLELRKATELNRLKDHFLSTLSHEMKTPLSLICGYAELLEEKYPSEELLAGVLDGSRRLNEHITSLLEYSALITGTLPLDMAEVGMAEAAQHAIAQLRDRLEERRLTLELELDPEIPNVRGDFRRISQMMLKLLENAVKFTPEGGKVGLRVGVDDGQVRIDVRDTGPGIPEQEFHRIWEAFTQLDVEDAFRKGGLGLGLTMVKKLAELHGGRVAVVSQLGKGATFSINLPQIRPEPEAAEVRPERSIPERPERPPRVPG